jgi:polysaccharide deacetylase family protein (PEP-CTERM system associated)
MNAPANAATLSRDERPEPAACTALRVEEFDGGRIGDSVANAMTIDVEDYFQVEALASTIDRREWENMPRRVEHNTGRLLEILAESGVEATFFVLGWVAERHPGLVRRIVSARHELASHGFGHQRADRQSPAEFRDDARRSKRILEDVGGVQVRGYRAPTFSIGSGSKWAHAILAEEGYLYSSSVYPVKRDLYGTPEAPRTPFVPAPGIVEFPLTSVRLLGLDIPASGGGYFRLLPYPLSRALLRRAAQVNGAPAVFYLHPWEIDPEQPRHGLASWKSRFRHYCNLDRTEPRLRRLLRDFTWTRMDRLFLSAKPPPYPVVTSWTDRKPVAP